jgi:hypothetical protein
VSSSGGLFIGRVLRTSWLDRELSTAMCVFRGRQRGLVLVRSYWLADDDLQPWVAEFEIAHRRLVATHEAGAHGCDPDEVATRIFHCALEEAGIGWSKPY